jgi:hypothetical protein
MPDDLPPPRLAPDQGERLTRAEYKADFRQRNAETEGHGSWKLERHQHFEEQDHPSRDAFRRGDWPEAVRLLEIRRDELRRAIAEDERRGAVFHRVRVVEEPLTPYVQWELLSLRVRAECGAPIRVVGAERVRAWESGGLLPEVVVLGGRVLYEVLYTAEGVTAGAARFTDPGLIGQWEEFIRALYAGGEDVTSYVDRYVAQLPPPLPTTRGS